MFIDPEEERRLQREREMLLKKRETPMLKLKNGTTIAM
jgi:hypothetical protein